MAAKALPRLKRRPEFLAVAGAGRKAVAPGLVLQARARDGGGIRVGFTVSRRVGGAVSRNRARRRLRALAQEIMAERAKDGFDYVLIGRAATVTRPYDRLAEDLLGALRRLGCLRAAEASGTGTS